MRPFGAVVSDCLYPLRATLATLGLIGAALPVCSPLPAKGGQLRELSRLLRHRELRQLAKLHRKEGSMSE
jgi:hypothetical protein